MFKGNRGQLSIFMGITLIVVMGMLAFIINVGLFVKAKINLQNATDAAAFSGAATQARQLTNIAYVNWEMRNTYKEWMFKYYILGQLGLMPKQLSDTNLAGRKPINFLLENPPIAGFKKFDEYNIPSICIHNSANTNICPLYSLPGIPRFPAIGVAGITEIHEAFVNKLVEEKGKDCSRRSAGNFLTALTWAFGSGNGDIPEAPLVASNRPGAWPQAIELAFRMRNLEMIVNLPPVADLDRAKVNGLQSQGAEVGLNERPVKAFMSAYRNLSGGAYKDDGSDELSNNFKLTELAPKPFNATANSLSGVLIPAGSKALDKYYLDLQMMPVNFATIFSTFVDTANQNDAIGGVVAEAGCGISKSALPVPGYILGFNKNPKVLTYYAVKAESKFIGLFFPIGGSEGIKLTAYAAAKPFGGRIGPKLFGYENNETLKARTDLNHRSSSYINGLQIAGNFTPGMPIPSSSTKFWVNQSNPILGGVPKNGEVFFAIPNLIYDFKDSADLDVQQSAGSGLSSIQLISKLPFPLTIGVSTEQKLGLYFSTQFKALKDSLGTVSPGTTLSGDQVMNSIVRARRATKYDAINYLIPDFREVNEKNNAAPIVHRLGPINNVGFNYKLFAPLFGDDLLYHSAAEITAVVNSYIKSNDTAIDDYLQALLEVANSIYNTSKTLKASSGQTTQGDYTAAARSIHINSSGNNADNPRPNPLTAASCNNLDMASKFNHFFRATNPACGLIPLEALMLDFLKDQSKIEMGVDKRLFYIGMYYDEPSSTLIEQRKPEDLMTAYFPSERQGTAGGSNAVTGHPLGLNGPGVESYSAKRNFYSTKFFHLAKIIDNPPSIPANSTRGSSDYHDQPPLRENFTNVPSDLLSEGITIENPLKYDGATGINNNYFLDF